MANGMGNPGAGGGFSSPAATDLDMNSNDILNLDDITTVAGSSIAAKAITATSISTPGAGASSEIYGASAAAAGANAIAIGNGASASSTDDIAIGTSASSAGTDNNIVIGNSASSAGSGSVIRNVVIGNTATSSSVAQNVVIGYAAAATASQVISIGTSSSSASSNTVAIGKSSFIPATSSNSIAIGNNAGFDTAGCSSGVVIGADAQNSAAVASTGIVCIGKSTRAKTNSIAIGNAAVAQHTNALAIGASATTTANNDAQIGTAAQPYAINTYGTFTHKAQALTAGTMTETAPTQLRSVLHQYSWTNAMVVALGATGTGNISVCTLPAKTVITNAYVVITGAAAGPATVTVSVGRTGAGYIDYIVASDAKAAANTVYGDGAAERGTNLTGYDLPSYTGTTVVNAQFVASANLDTVTGSTGTIYLETMILP